MALTIMKASQKFDAHSAQIGDVSTTLDGVRYIGSYRVHADGSGRQRHSVTPDKRVTVVYGDQTKYTSVGLRGLEWTAEILLSELVIAQHLREQLGRPRWS